MLFPTLIVKGSLLLAIFEKDSSISFASTLRSFFLLVEYTFAVLGLSLVMYRGLEGAESEASSS